MTKQVLSAMVKLHSMDFWMHVYGSADVDQMSRLASRIIGSIERFRSEEGRKVSVATVLGALRACEGAVVMAVEEGRK